MGSGADHTKVKKLLAECTTHSVQREEVVTFEEFEAKYDWSLYRDHEKREMAFRAGQQSNRDAVQAVLDAANSWADFWIQNQHDEPGEIELFNRVRALNAKEVK